VVHTQGAHVRNLAKSGALAVLQGAGGQCAQKVNAAAEIAVRHDSFAQEATVRVLDGERRDLVLAGLGVRNIRVQDADALQTRAAGTQ
jgi:hypothetical protein